MSKIIISPGFGCGFPGEFEHRIDPVLIECVEKLNNLNQSKMNRTARNEIINLMIARFYQLDITVSAEDCQEYRIVNIPSGKRFMIEEYDGAEYIILEDDLIHTAP